MLSNTDTAKKRARAEVEPSLIFGITRKDPTTVELWIKRDGKWTLVKEDLLAIVKNVMNDEIYKHLYLKS